MATLEEVRQFLDNFKVKMQVFDILFRDERGKNTQAMLRLEISHVARRKIIESLEPQDFSEGPLDDKLYGIGNMWVFGKSYKREEIYIKISMGRRNDRVICISFHQAEHPIHYPYKKR